jgi:hypothetical protein
MIHIQGPCQDWTSGGSRRTRQYLIQAQRSNFCVGPTHQFAFISSSATLQKKRAKRMKSLFFGRNFFCARLQNLQNEIAVSPMDLTLNRAKLTLMMDGGWDQPASGKAYNTLSGRLVSVGPRTNKVCGLVYYSKR